MAGIDKIYGSKTQLKNLRDWLTKNKPEYLRYVTILSDIPENEKVFAISNFPKEADLWLYLNCPIKTITDRIAFQYGFKGEEPKK